MVEYRLYCLDAAGKFTKVHEFTAANDEEARATARELGDGARCELWDRNRLVELIPLDQP